MSAEAIVGLFVCSGVVLTLLLSLMTGAFVAGKHSNRITSLEERQTEAEKEVKAARIEAAKANAQMAGFEATLNAIDEKVHSGFEDLKRAIRDLGLGRRTKSGGAD